MKIKPKIEKTIKAYTVLGLSLYKRKRIYEDVIDLNFEHVVCDDIGLYAIGKFPRIEYNNFRYSEKLNWKKNAYETIRFTLFNLINNGVIQIIRTVDRRSYSFNLIKNKKTDYHFRLIKSNTDKDLFSTIVYNSIREVNKKEYPTLSEYINNILDVFFNKNNSQKNPERFFLVSLLKEYADSFSWIEIITKKKFLGIYKDYSFRVEEIYIPRINMQHQSLITIENKFIYENGFYSSFCNSFKILIEKNFKYREPDDYSDD